jgi:hypothetical protein
MAAAQEPIEARDEVGAVHDLPAVFEHLPGILDAGDLEDVDRVVVAQRVRE